VPHAAMRATDSRRGRALIRPRLHVRTLLATPIDGASLAALRAGFGLVIMLESLSLHLPRPTKNLIELRLAGPGVHWHFPYQGFEWIRAWHEPWMSLHCLLLGIAGACLVVGLMSRTAALVVFLTWTYLWLIDASNYNNHYYLISLLALLMCFMPVGRVASLDALWRRRPTVEAAGTIPFWPVFLLRGQMALVYFYAGVAKLNAEWLWHAQPMLFVLRGPDVQGRLSRLVSSEFAADVASPRVAFVLSYAGLAFDLSIAFLLLARRTRLAGVVLAVLFHALNHFVLFRDIDWFPLLGVLTTTIFLAPDWPRRAASSLGGMLRWPRAPVAQSSSLGTTAPLGRWATSLIFLWLAIQAVLPWRHVWIAGDVNWTAEGERLSWRMKSTAKAATELRIRLVDPHLITRDAQGRAQLDWSQWRDRPVAYRHVRAPDVDWRLMHEWLVVVEPLHGERIVFNPWALPPGHEISEAAVRERIARHWQRTYGRRPRVELTHTTAEMLEGFDAELAKRGAPMTYRQQVGQARQLAATLQQATDRRERRRLLGLLNQNLAILSLDERFGGLLRSALATLHPLSTQGAAVTPLRFFQVTDRELLRMNSDGSVSVREDRWISAARGPLRIHLDLERMGESGWRILPRALVCEISAGQPPEIWWNAQAELIEFQLAVMKTRPILCHQYASRVAALWQTKYGRRPQVFFTCLVALVPYKAQFLIDPKVDLAAQPLSLLSHNDWIAPLERTLPTHHRDTEIRKRK